MILLHFLVTNARCIHKLGYQFPGIKITTLFFITNWSIMTIGLVLFALINFHERNWREKKLNSPKNQDLVQFLYPCDFFQISFILTSDFWSSTCKLQTNLVYDSKITNCYIILTEKTCHWSCSILDCKGSPCQQNSSSSTLHQIELKQNCFAIFLSGHHPVWTLKIMKLIYKVFCLHIIVWTFELDHEIGSQSFCLDIITWTLKISWNCFTNFCVWTLKIMNHEYCYWNLWEKNFGSWLLLLQQHSINRSIDRSIDLGAWRILEI